MMMMIIIIILILLLYIYEEDKSSLFLYINIYISLYIPYEEDMSRTLLPSIPFSHKRRKHQIRRLYANTSEMFSFHFSATRFCFYFHFITI